MHAFDILGDPIRRRILEHLASGELAAGEIALSIQEEFSITQGAVSQHLKVLRDAGFASSRKDGVRRIYAVEPEAFREANLWLDQFRHFWEPKLDALATEITRGKLKRKQEGS